MESGTIKRRSLYVGIICVLIFSACLLLLGYIFASRKSPIARKVYGNGLGKQLPISVLGIVEKIGKNDMSLRVTGAKWTEGGSTSGEQANLRINSKTECYRTTVNENGNLVPQRSDIKDLKKGEAVSIEAVLSLRSVPDIFVSKIIVSPDKTMLERSTHKSPMTDGRVIFGTASGVLASGFTLTDMEGKEIKIAVDKDVDVVAGGSKDSRPAVASYSEVINGAKLSLFGEVMANGEIKAIKIAVSK